MAQFFDKYPAEVRDFGYDASDILLGGDTIQSVSVQAISTGITIVSSSFSGTIVSFRCSGGVPGNVANVAVFANLTSGQVREGIASILIKPVPTT